VGECGTGGAWIRVDGAALPRTMAGWRIPHRIVINPRQCGGCPWIRGMRIRVVDVLELLAEGMTVDEVLRQHPDLFVRPTHAEREVRMHVGTGTLEEQVASRTWAVLGLLIGALILPGCTSDDRPPDPVLCIVTDTGHVHWGESSNGLQAGVSVAIEGRVFGEPAYRLGLHLRRATGAGADVSVVEPHLEGGVVRAEFTMPGGHRYIVASSDPPVDRVVALQSESGMVERLRFGGDDLKLKPGLEAELVVVYRNDRREVAEFPVWTGEVRTAPVKVLLARPDGWFTMNSVLPVTETPEHYVLRGSWRLR
jgi:uncharacterized protein (DUF433 family)